MTDDQRSALSFSDLEDSTEFSCKSGWQVEVLWKQTMFTKERLNKDIFDGYMTLN